MTGTWVPDPSLPSDPAPASVIITETSTATGVQSSTNASGQSVQSAGKADDGLGQNDPQDPVTGKVSGTRYSAPAISGGVFTVSVALSASSGATSGPNGYDGDGDYFTGSAVCSASVGPVTISTTTPAIGISGTHNPTQEDNRVLTGQQITTNLSGTIGTITTYTWSLSSSQYVFKNYDPAQSSNQLVPLASADLTGPAPPATTVSAVPALSFYDRVQENLTVSCAVTLTAPDNKTVLNVSALTPQIIVLKPTASWGIQSGIVQKNANSLGLFGGSAPTFTDGQYWHDIVVQVPDPFSGGTFCFAQLITPSIKDQGTVPQGSMAPTNVQLKYDGQIGLDNAFPYTNHNGPPNGYSLSQPAHTEVDGDAPLITEPPAPSVQNSDGSAAPGGTSWSSEVSNQAFTTYLMYKPSSAGAVWIPLQSYLWNWNGSWNLVVPSDPLDSSYWSATPGSPTTPSNPTAQTTNEPPQWSLTHLNGETFVASH